MKIYNVRIGIKSLLPKMLKSFTSLKEAHEFYCLYHPDMAKELNEKDTLNSYYKKIILEVA